MPICGKLRFSLYLVHMGPDFVCIWYVVGTWLVRGGYAVGTWLVRGGYVVGTWLVRGWYVDSTQIVEIRVP